MRANELYAELKKITKNVACVCFNEPVNPPYIVYLQNKIVYGGDYKKDIETDLYRVELYTERRDMKTEQKIETMLRKNHIDFDADYSAYITDERLYLTVYTFETNFKII